MVTLQKIIQTVQAYNPKGEASLIQKAGDFAKRVHQGQERASGDPYIIHPLEVAEILSQMRLDVPSIVAGLLHDTIEDTLATEKEIREIFGEDVEFLVNAVTKISQISFASHEEKQAENFRKMLLFQFVNLFGYRFRSIFIV